MDPRWGACVVAFLLAGCAAGEEPRGQTPQEGTAGTTAAGPAPAILRFASGDHEGNLTFEAAFSSLDACFVTCTATAEQSFDLTSIIPEQAPVELAVVIDGTDGAMAADLVLEDASAPRQSVTYQGDQVQLAATLVRGPAGRVSLHLMHFLPLSPSADPVDVRIEARAVVRSDQLLPRIPAQAELRAGDSLAIAGSNVTQALLLGPNGFAQRLAAGAGNLTLPDGAPAGTYTLLLEGGSAVVTGPNTTLTARRTEAVFGDYHPVAAGSPTQWQFEAATVPLQVGVVVRSRDESQSPPWSGPLAARVAAPDGAIVAQGENDCAGPLCYGGGFSFTFVSPFLHESLAAGIYGATAEMETGDSVEAAGFYVTVL